MNKLLKLTAASSLLATSAAYGQIEITENLTVTGFIDMSAGYSKIGDDTSSHYDLDQFEIDFIYSYDRLTAQVDLDHQRGQDGIELEQAFITYDLGEGTSLTAGKFLSYLGWETAEPTGLYQYSYAYGIPTIPGYHNGISIDHSADWGSIGLALLDSVYDDDGSLGTSDDDYEMGIEAKLVLTPVEGLTLFLGYGLDRADTGSWFPIDDRKVFNFWTSYEFDVHTLAAEYVNYSEGDYKVDQYLAMWNMKVSDDGSFTLRYSEEKEKWSGQGFQRTTKYTAAYLHTLTDNLALIGEVSRVKFPGRVNGTELALEALFTF